MKVRTALLFLCLSLSTLIFADERDQTKHRILYLARQGHLADAIDLYRHLTKESEESDYDLLQQLGLVLLEQGFASNKPECQLLAVYGAGIAVHDRATHLLAEGLDTGTPEVQLASLDFLARQGNDEAAILINSAASSPHLLIRFSALHALAQRRHPLALGQVQALYYKVIPELHPLFPQLFALLGGPGATRQLRKMLHDSNEEVRLETILSVGKAKRDDLLPQIRMYLSHPHAREQEACARVVGEMKDQSSMSALTSLTKSRIPDVRLAGCAALYELGQHDIKSIAEEMAKQGNLFAISLLGNMEGTEALLVWLLEHGDLQVRCNATLALLQRRDPRCLKGLPEILLKDSRDLAFEEIATRGRSLHAWRAVPSATVTRADKPLALELSTAMREDVLSACLDLPQPAFFSVIEMIFQKPQTDLVPLAVELLQNLATPAAIQVLKAHQQHVGVPLVRNYCTLALFKIGESGPYADALRQWVIQQQAIDIIQFRPYVPWEKRESGEHYQLTPQETSRLFISAVEALGNQHSEEGLQVLLDLIRDGNANNRFALAGLLIRSAQ